MSIRDRSKGWRKLCGIYCGSQVSALEIAFSVSAIEKGEAVICSCVTRSPRVPQGHNVQHNGKSDMT